jgi:hypothetical protein
VRLDTIFRSRAHSGRGGTNVEVGACVFVTYVPTQDFALRTAGVNNLSLTAAWADLGSIAGRSTQRGVYISVWLGY